MSRENAEFVTASGNAGSTFRRKEDARTKLAWITAASLRQPNGSPLGGRQRVKRKVTFCHCCVLRPHIKAVAEGPNTSALSGASLADELRANRML